MDPRHQPTSWLYLPTTVIRVPSWLAEDVKAYCHERERQRAAQARQVSANTRKNVSKKKTKRKRK